ncbi:hypothetical protein FBU30_009793 [Linnemannia zychae]|nr:hypothetical protein FBU30_009793 [Linnemannia zychae]
MRILQHSVTFLILLTWRVSAQAPDPVSSMAYTTVDENTLYIQGGQHETATGVFKFNAFWSLDLTRKWDASAPLWSAYPYGGVKPTDLTTSFHTMVYSSTFQLFYFWNPLKSIAINYYVANKTWEVLAGTPGRVVFETDGYTAAMDSTNNRLYIPGGAGTNMFGYDFSVQRQSLNPMPMMSTIGWNGYTFVWSEVRKSYLLWGGNGPPATSYFYEFRPENGNPWVTLNTTGTVPRQLSQSCMVSAYNGTIMLLFGGHSTDLTYFSKSLYILDIKSMTWSQVPDRQNADSRSAMACSVSGDNFIAWGGFNGVTGGLKVTAPGAPIIYNLFTKSWTTSYVPGNHFGSPTTMPTVSKTATSIGEQPTGSTPETTVPKSGGNNGGIIGGAVGGVLLLVMIFIGIFIVRRRRQRQQKQIQIESFPQICDLSRNTSLNYKNNESIDKKLAYAPQVIPDKSLYNIGDNEVTKNPQFMPKQGPQYVNMSNLQKSGDSSPSIRSVNSTYPGYIPPPSQSNNQSPAIHPRPVSKNRASNRHRDLAGYLHNGSPSQHNPHAYIPDAKDYQIPPIQLPPRQHDPHACAAEELDYYSLPTHSSPRGPQAVYELSLPSPPGRHAPLTRGQMEELQQQMYAMQMAMNRMHANMD